jgi:hypothetical protein
MAAAMSRGACVIGQSIGAAVLGVLPTATDRELRSREARL